MIATAPAVMSATEETSAACQQNGDQQLVIQLTLLKVLWSSSQTQGELLPLNDVPYVLRAFGITVSGEEEKNNKDQVEQTDGLPTPVSAQTLQNWLDREAEYGCALVGGCAPCSGHACVAHASQVIGTWSIYPT